MSKQAADIKKHITGGSTPALLDRNPATLATGEHDDLMWATNRYWLTPAVRVAALLDEYNQPTDVPGTYQVNGSVRRTGDGVKPGIMLGQPQDYPVNLAPVRFGGEQAYVRPAKIWLAVYRTADGATFGLNAEDLAWLSDLSGLGPSMGQPAAKALGLGKDEHFGEVRVQGAPPKPEGTYPQKLALVADVIRTITPYHYEDNKPVPAVTENLGPRVVGMMTAVRLGG